MPQTVASSERHSPREHSVRAAPPRAEASRRLEGRRRPPRAPQAGWLAFFFAAALGGASCGETELFRRLETELL
eukprot:CAMPEP_0184381528 /NCGR_PEP_ID=MMETSP0007-20130409/5581_1 /TAXON_ID=97485 /ORGANISM="Prymnesium parvum, Strain Texoma1" /LENGTH=73 /DNA_ID=CAMNT_0026727163 /DNA_START=178 /DNA_END=395 /DNA_ORIENTATION=-